MRVLSAGIASLLACVTTTPSGAQQAKVHVHTDSVAVGDRFHITVSVERPAGAQALFPSPARGDSALGDLEIVEVVYGTRPFAGAAGLVRDSARYVVTTFVLDSAQVPSIPVLLVDGGDTLVAATNPASIPVRSLVPPDADDVLDLAPIVPFRPALWPWILALLLAAATVAAVLLYFRRRRQGAGGLEISETQESPYDEAMRRLDALERFDLDGTTEVKPFYVELADVLRTYVERSTGIPALESTTCDLLRTLERRQMGGLPSTAVALTRRVLEIADLAKFADVRPPATRGYESIGETRLIVEEIEQSMRPEPEVVESDG